MHEYVLIFAGTSPLGGHYVFIAKVGHRFVTINDSKEIVWACTNDIGKCQLFFYQRINAEADSQALQPVENVRRRTMDFPDLVLEDDDSEALQPAVQNLSRRTMDFPDLDLEDDDNIEGDYISILQPDEPNQDVHNLVMPMDVDAHYDGSSLAKALKEPLRRKRQKQMRSDVSWTFLDSIQKELIWWLLMENKRGQNSWFIASVNAIILTKISAKVYVLPPPDHIPKEKWSFVHIFRLMFHADPGTIIDVQPIVDKLNFLNGPQALASPCLTTFFGLDSLDGDDCPWLELKHTVISKLTTEPCKCSKTKEPTVKENIHTQSLMVLELPERKAKRSRKKAPKVTLQDMINSEFVQETKGKCEVCKKYKLTTRTEMKLHKESCLESNQGLIIHLKRSPKREDGDDDDFEINETLELPTDGSGSYSPTESFKFVCAIQQDGVNKYHVNYKANTESVIAIRDDKPISASNAKNVKKSELFFYARSTVISNNDEIMAFPSDSDEEPW